MAPMVSLQVYMSVALLCGYRTGSKQRAFSQRGVLWEQLFHAESMPQFRIGSEGRLYIEQRVTIGRANFGG